MTDRERQLVRMIDKLCEVVNRDHEWCNEAGPGGPCYGCRTFREAKALLKDFS